MPDRKIGIVGTGYVGLVTAAGFAHRGLRVVCHDIHAARIAALQSGVLPFYEPGLAEALAGDPDIEFTDDPERLYRRAGIVFVCVDTPPRDDGAADLSRVEAVIAAIPIWASPVIVMKSTVPVGTGHRIQARLSALGRRDIAYISSPEFLREGSAIADVRNPDRIVIGGTDAAAIDRVAMLYAGDPAPVIRTDVTSAELIKYASNAFLATKVSFINEIANLCDAVGANIDTVASGMGLDHRIGPSFLHAGVGYGGSCFAKDISALQHTAAAHATALRVVTAAQRANADQAGRVIEQLRAHLGVLDGARIAVLGLSFKAHTSDIRNSVSLAIAELLARAGANLVCYDPVVQPADVTALPPCTAAGTLEHALAGADGAVIATEWPQFHGLIDPAMAASMRTPLIVDGRNLLEPAAAIAAGYTYEGIGRPSTNASRTAIQPRQSTALRAAA
jgi:UDPglucose 6-dehydrogenase